MAKKHWISVAVGGAVLVTMLVVSFNRSAGAQPYGPGMMGGGWGGPGFMMGPGMMGGRGYGRMCAPGAAGFTEWRMDRLAQIIKPSDEQRTKLDELKRASATAFEAMRNSCTANFPETIPERMKAMETRMETMLQAVKVVRPAMDAFYASLNDEQKRQVDNTGPGRFWRNRGGW